MTTWNNFKREVFVSLVLRYFSTCYIISFGYISAPWYLFYNCKSRFIYWEPKDTPGTILGRGDPSVKKKKKVCLHGIYAGGDGGAGNDKDQIIKMLGAVLCITYYVLYIGGQECLQRTYWESDIWTNKYQWNWHNKIICTV